MKKAILLTFALTCATSLWAKPDEVSALCEKIGITDLRSDTVVAIPSVSITKSVVLEYDRRPKHVGVSLFSPEVKSMTNRAVCNFVERLFLRLSLGGDPAEEARYLSRNKITIKKNGVAYGSAGFKNFRPVIESIDQPAKFNIERNGSDMKVTFEYGSNNTLVVSFPAASEIVSGLDKKEADEAMSDYLQSTTRTARIYKAPTKGQLVVAGAGVLKRPGNNFMIKKLTGDTYYNLEGKPLNDPSHPDETIQNMMLGEIDGQVKITVKHRMYGLFTPDFVTDLKDFIDHFDNDYDLYTSSQKLDDTQTQYLTIMHNNTLNVVHMLIVTANPDDMLAKGKTVRADFFSNIPQHYLKSLF